MKTYFISGHRDITEEEFTSAWDGNPIKVPAGATIELTHHLAAKMTKELVDKIMIGNAKLNELEHYSKNPNTQPNMYRAPSSRGVPSARKVWEDQICRQLDVDEESPQIQVIRAQIRSEIMADLNTEAPKNNPLENAPKSIEEFADLSAKPVVKEKAPIKVKQIK
jgi:hypothetical protein